MEITGRLLKILPETRGETQRGPWVRGGFVIETDGEYPRSVAFTTFGEDRLAQINSIPLNSMVIVNFTPESREYNERWYTDLRCSRVQIYVPGQMPPTTAGYTYSTATPVAPTQQPVTQQTTQPTQFASAPQSTIPGGTSMPASDDDLPF